MKKLLLCFILLLGFSTYSSAQNDYTEVVYLKDGSIIRGIIIEQVPNASLKIKTADDSIFAYPMENVIKITKEKKENSRYSVRRVYKPRTVNHALGHKSNLRGYAGFVDFGYMFDVSDNDADKVELSTSHGYQFNDHIFLGGGLALNYYAEQEALAVPIFANFKVNFLKTKITPFADVKLGYTAGDIEGAYSSMALGVRFALAKKIAMNLRLEYTYQGAKQEFSSYNYNYNHNYGNGYYGYAYYGYYSYSNIVSLNSIGFKVGLEF